MTGSRALKRSRGSSCVDGQPPWSLSHYGLAPSTSVSSITGWLSVLIQSGSLASLSRSMTAMAAIQFHASVGSFTSGTMPRRSSVSMMSTSVRISCLSGSSRRSTHPSGWWYGQPSLGRAWGALWPSCSVGVKGVFVGNCVIPKRRCLANFMGSRDRRS